MINLERPPKLKKKPLFHLRNKHQGFYNFDRLTAKLPELSSFVSTNKTGNFTIDFADPIAVKLLNKALLFSQYPLIFWEIPENYLCPPIPSRAEYIHLIADLLSFKDPNPSFKNVNILDIGSGANCIYPILGYLEYGWNFVGSEIDLTAFEAAKLNIEKNTILKNSIELRIQEDHKNIFKGIIKKEDFFDCTICNPPFHGSMEEANAGTVRKLKNLKKKTEVILNFGGQNTELWCKGGEIGFIVKMIIESTSFKNQCRWFTTLVSKKENLQRIYKMLKKVEVTQLKTIPLLVGNKKSRIVAWTFK